jgi:hypothetical protein
MPPAIAKDVLYPERGVKMRHAPVLNVTLGARSRPINRAFLFI